jgi:hypothetical protein
MNPQVQRLLDQITERLETAAAETVQELAREGVSILQQEFDTNRQQTRRAAKWRKLGAMEAEVGLFFARRYTRNKNAFTYREFERIVRNKLRPALAAKLVTKLNSKLHR